MLVGETNLPLAEQPDSAASVALERVRQSLLEREALAEAIGRLVGAITEQQAQLDQKLGAAVALLNSELGGGPRHQEVYAASVGAAGHPQAAFCLGTFDFFLGGARIDGWRPGKVRSLFQYLVSHHDRSIPRETLVQALWPDPDAQAGGISLKVAIHTLRRMLDQLGSRRANLAIQAHEASYRLAAPGLWLDVDEFEQSCALGRRLETLGQRREALALYARAVHLYRGDFLEESWEEWVLFRRESLKDQYLWALGRLADAALEQDDYHGCILRCRQLLEKDRCREDTYRTLMHCHARLGQRGRVRSWYELCARTLRAELDVEPEPETERLYHRALHGNV